MGCGLDEYLRVTAGGIQMRISDKALGYRLHIVMHQSEEPEAGHKDDQSLQGLEHRDDTNAARMIGMRIGVMS
jgi:hypothetical protein